MSAATAFSASNSVRPASAATSTPRVGSKCRVSQVGSTVKLRSGASLVCTKSGSIARWADLVQIIPESASTTSATTPVDGAGSPSTNIRIGFLDPTFRGQKVPVAASTARQVSALVERINFRGGIGGHSVEAVIRPFDLGQTGDAQVKKLCTAFADEDHVFAVVSQNVIVSTAARECFAKRKVLWIEGAGSFPLDTQTLARMAPYAFQVNAPASDRIGKSYARMLLDDHYFGTDPSAARVGIIAMRNDVSRRTTDAFASELGKRITPNIGFVDVASQATVNRDAAAIATAFASTGVTHVVSLLSSANVLPFLWAAEDAKFRPRMAFTSFDNLRVVQDPTLLKLRPVANDNLIDAVAMGFLPFVDTTDSQLAFPRAGAEVLCMSQLWGYGFATEDRYASRLAQNLCDGLTFLKTVGDRVASISTTLDAKVFSAEAELLGSSFDASLAWTTSFGPGHHDGGASYRPIRFDAVCRCFQYVGQLRPIE